MGFEPSLDYIRTRYGEGWSKKVSPNTGTPGAGANFSEQQLPSNQLVLDTAISKISQVVLSDTAVAMIQPVLDAIDGAADFEDALARLETAFPKIETNQLQGLLAQAMFGSDTVGCLSAASEG